MPNKLPSLGGFITSSQSHIGKQYKINKYGLFSQQIFGPIKKNECECGNLKGIHNKNKICSKCNVLCGSPELRSTQFGKIKLIFPVIKPTKKTEFLLIIKDKTIINPSKIDYNISEIKYLAFKIDKTKIKLTKKLGINKDYLTIPFRITGIYSLYLVIKFLAEKVQIKIAKKIMSEDFFIFELNVLPANLRMVYYNSKNQIHTPDINRFYTIILKLNQINNAIINNIAIDENDYIEKIKINLKNKIFDQDINDYIITEYDQKTSTYQKYVNSIYDSVYNELSGKTGLIRNSILGRTIEFSARSVVYCDPSLPAYQIKISRKILKKLWMPYFLYYLTNIEHIEYNVCFDKIMLYQKENQQFVNKKFSNFVKWFESNIICDNSLTPEERKLARLLIVNRQPTLWRHSAPCVESIACDDEDNDAIGISPLMIHPLNMDFDGDTAAIYAIHSQNSLKELKEKVFLNTYKYDSDSKMLNTIRHEALYAAYILTDGKTSNISPIKIENLDNLSESNTNYNNIESPIQINNKIYSYGLCLFNKKCGFKNIIIDFQINSSHSNKLSEILLEQSIDLQDYNDRLRNLNVFLYYFISSSIYSPSINLNEMIDVLDDNTYDLFNKIPTNNIDLGFLLNRSLVERCINSMNKYSSFYKLFKSGSRFNKSQLSSSCINVGYIADVNNNVEKKPIITNLLKGLSPEDFFKYIPGCRKGIADKELYTPQSGYMERTLTMALSIMELSEDDCHTHNYLETIIFSENHAKCLVDKYYKLDPNDKELKILDFKTAKSLINRKIYLRSPMLCQTKNFKICKKCFGNRFFPTQYVGIVAGQVLAERITQLIMRTFHTSGSAELPFDNSEMIFYKNHLKNIYTEKNLICVEVDTNKIPEIVREHNYFNFINGPKIYFNQIDKNIKNSDIIQTMNNIKSVLKTYKAPINHPFEFYNKLCSYLLEVGTPYSSFIEMLLAHMFICEKNKLWRYNPNEPIVKKLSDKKTVENLNKQLGCLFQPNSKSLNNIDSFNNNNSLSIYEEIFFEEL